MVIIKRGMLAITIMYALMTTSVYAVLDQGIALLIGQSISNAELAAPGIEDVAGNAFEAVVQAVPAVAAATMAAAGQLSSAVAQPVATVVHDLMPELPEMVATQVTRASKPSFMQSCINAAKRYYKPVAAVVASTLAVTAGMYAYRQHTRIKELANELALEKSRAAGIEAARATQQHSVQSGIAVIKKQLGTSRIVGILERHKNQDLRHFFMKWRGFTIHERVMSEEI